jgi:hypothetical protein
MGIASLRQTGDGLLSENTSLRERAEHPGLPGVLSHSVKLRTSTPGYIAEIACQGELLDLAGMMPTQQCKSMTIYF